MYRKILVALENSRADQTLLPHIAELASLHHSELLLVHVADGYVARNFNQLNLAESQEMKDDRAYLESSAETLRQRGLTVDTFLALGDPAEGIVKAAEDQRSPASGAGARFTRPSWKVAREAMTKHEIRMSKQ